jgi:hypothetical protein
MHHPDPYAADKTLFTVTADNMAQYADKLTAGQQAMLKTYPSYKMNVYPTHRSAAAPQRIYDATKATAVSAQLAEGGNGVNGAINGIPFPIPEKGIEVIWNHILRWRGNAFDRNFGLAPMTRGGDFTMVEFNEKGDFRYSHEGSLLLPVLPGVSCWSTRPSIRTRKTVAPGSTILASGACVVLRTSPSTIPKKAATA